MGRIDLHLHSTYSDGTFSPTEVVTRAVKAQVSTLAITDHDTTEGIQEAWDAADHLPIEVIPGIEISSLYQGRETHVLGYDIDVHNHSFQEHLTSLRTSRLTRIPRILSKLSELGLPLQQEAITKIAGHGSIGRPHVAQALVDKQYVRTVDEAFRLYLAEGAPGHVPRDLPDATEVIQWIREAGGVPVLAHPSWVRNQLSELQTVCKQLYEAGLQGIEVFYSTHTPRQTSDYLNLARQLNLLVTGGSDFHGTTRPDIHVGIGKGNLNVSIKLLEPLRECAEENKKTLK